MKKLILFFIVISVLLVSCKALETVNTNIDDYDTDREGVGFATEKMPELDSLGEYSKIEYSYKKACYSKPLQFYSHGFALFVQYDSETYEQEKSKVLDVYTFLEEPIKDSMGENYIIPLTEFNYKGYSISVAADPGSIDMCKSFLMIGFDDDNGVIVYMYYYDQDRDYIAEKDANLRAEMEQLIDESFEWMEI